MITVIFNYFSTGFVHIVYGSPWTFMDWHLASVMADNLREHEYRQTTGTYEYDAAASCTQYRRNGSFDRPRIRVYTHAFTHARWYRRFLDWHNWCEMDSGPGDNRSPKLQLRANTIVYIGFHLLHTGYKMTISVCFISVNFWNCVLSLRFFLKKHSNDVKVEYKN